MPIDLDVVFGLAMFDVGVFVEEVISDLTFDGDRNKPEGGGARGGVLNLAGGWIGGVFIDYST